MATIFFNAAIHRRGRIKTAGRVITGLQEKLTRCVKNPFCRHGTFIRFFSGSSRAGNQPQRHTSCPCCRTCGGCHCDNSCAFRRQTSGRTERHEQCAFELCTAGAHDTVVFYFLLIRPQQKREKERQKQLKALEKGDKVLTRGGIFGTIVGLKPEENVAMVKIADDVKESLIATLENVVNKAN